MNRLFVALPVFDAARSRVPASFFVTIAYMSWALRRRSVRLWCACLLSVMLCWMLGATSLETATIELASKSESATLAAAELAKHLELACGTRPRTVASGGLFVIGRAPDEMAPVQDFESHAAVRGGRVYCWGDDGTKPSSGYGALKTWGTLFGVYGFLERFLDARWVFPGDDGIVLRRTSDVDLCEGWSYAYAPPLEKSVVRTFSEPTWPLRLRLQSRDLFAFGHAFVNWQPRFEKTHPEYVALNADGTRGCVGKRYVFSQQCLSNPDVQAQMLADWVQAGKPKRLNLCLNDSWYHCRCAKCREWDADLPGERFELHKTDRTLRFYNLMCVKAASLNPEVEVCAYGYLDFRLPPRRERVADPDRLVLAFVPMVYDDFCAVVDGWKAVGLRKFLVRPNYLCYNGLTPRGYERQFFAEFRALRAQGMLGRDEDTYERDIITDFEAYALARAIADERVDFETVEREFLSQFGSAASAMATYYQRVRTRGEAERARERRARVLDIVSATKDDGQLCDCSVGGHSVEDLRGDLAVLARAAAIPGLTAVEARRIARVRACVELAVHARRLWESWKSWSVKPREAAAKAEMLTRYRALKAYADAHAEVIGNLMERALGCPTYVAIASRQQ